MLDTWRKLPTYFKPLPPELKRQWCAALRSGTFYQGYSICLYIRNGRREYCALGVFGQVCLKMGDMELLGAYNLPVEALMNKATQRILRQMNDGTDLIRRHSFSEIASFIEDWL